MDKRLLLFWLRAFLCVSLIQAAPVSENFVVSVSSNVTVQSKRTAILPCWLSPQQSAEEMEVNWFYRDQFDAPVLIYKDKTLNTASQPAYSGRVSFDQKDASSGGLKDGDVTLKLVNVTLTDAGEYTCYVSSDKHHDRAIVNLFVTQTGAPPLLTVVVKENNKLNVSCESSGWYPKPKLQWSDGSSALTPKAVVYSEASSRLMSVHSWLLVSSSSAVSCSVGLSGEEALEGRMLVRTPDSQAQEGSGSSVAGWVLFALLAVALGGLLGFLFYKKHKGTSSKSDTVDAAGEAEELLPKDLLPVKWSALDEVKYVNVQLQKDENEFIKIKGNILRDAPRDFPDGDKVTYLTAVRGTAGFSSGKHYWEVSLGQGNVDPKQSWWIGVTNRSESLKDYCHSPTTDNGFWFLSSSHDNPEILQFSSKPCIYLGVSVMPQKIRVFLDYDGGKLGFYNADSKSLICFFSTKFSGTVFPLFNPGKGDKAPMEIIQKQDESSNTSPPMTNNDSSDTNDKNN